jgi:hypothetical protein
MKGRGRKRSWHSLSYLPGIFLEGLRITSEFFSQDSWSPRRDLNPEPAEYEAVVLTTPLRSSLSVYFCL